MRTPGRQNRSQSIVRCTLICIKCTDSPLVYDNEKQNLRMLGPSIRGNPVPGFRSQSSRVRNAQETSDEYIQRT